MTERMTEIERLKADLRNAKRREARCRAREAKLQLIVEEVTRTARYLARGRRQQMRQFRKREEVSDD